MAHRLALDHPERVEKLAVLDIVPTIEHFERADMAFALGYYHWFWFAQPHPFPEVLINAAPEAWFTRAHRARAQAGELLPSRGAGRLPGAARNPEMIRGMCEDYRAAATHRPGARPRLPRRRRQGAMPDAGAVGLQGQDRPVVRPARHLAAVLRGRGDRRAVDSGHYLAEEAPGEVLERSAVFRLRGLGRSTCP